jgi:3-dehydroquinate synthase
MTVQESTVKVTLSDRSYDIRIKPGIIAEVGPCLNSLGFTGAVAIVTNPTVSRRYASTVKRSLTAAGFRPLLVVIPAGERVKTLRGVGIVLDRFASARFERTAVVLALGGGVIGDLAGFAAAIYARGIPFVQVPTTLVAQVDSSIGGKTGVNHLLGKNLIGAFHQPRLVLIDPDTLRSLPRREWIAGLAEVIKYGMISDEDFFSYLEQRMGDILRHDAEPVRRIITRSCEIKAGVVMQDERESDRRRILNYGHTIGHALESLGNYRAMIHGEAVAIGMVQEAELAASLGLCAPAVVPRLRALVKAAGLPDAVPPTTTFPALWAAMRHDKKVSGGQVYCVLPERVGRVIVAPIEQQQAKRWFERHAHGSRASGTGPLRVRTQRAGR